MNKSIIYLCMLFAMVFISCGDKWDEYYNGNDGSKEEELDQTLQEFFAEHSEYNAFYKELELCGLDEELTKDQQLTLWVVNDDAMAASGIDKDDTLRMKYHMNYLPFLQSDLKDGLRIPTLNNIYLQITRQGEEVYVNRSKVESSYRLKNGVVHVISELMKSKINMFDYIKSLPDEYSMFRDSIMKNNEMLFDKANSIPTGVDITGNTEYDSVFYVYNPLFEKAQFNSEFKQFTLFLPDNEVLKDCFTKLNTQYKAMGKTVTAVDSANAMTWIKEAAFYTGELKTFTDADISSAFGRIWRPGIQEIDQSSMEELSNGILYKMTEVKIPTNYILTRIKSLVHYYEYLTEAEQQQYYTFMNTTKISIFEDSATPKPEILSNYYILDLNGDEEASDFWVEFPPLERYRDKDTDPYRARMMQVPCGEYDLYMGFHSSGHPYVNVYFDGDTDGTTSSPDANMQLIGSNLSIVSSTPWNFDRVNETTADLYGDKIVKWDGLGGPVGTVTVKGDGMSSFRIRVEFYKGDSKKLRIYHWALKPSANNY